MPSEVLLDVSMMEAPFPLQLSIENATNLQEAQYVKMVHRMKPCHLFGFLEKMSIWWYDFENGTDEYLVFMAKANDDASIEFLKGKIADEYDRIVA